METSIVQSFVEGRRYTREEIGPAIGADTRRVGLPTKDGKVKCAIVKKDLDVAPPDVLLISDTKDRFRRGKVLCDQHQDDPIPIFVHEGERAGLAAYRYCGRYKVSHWSEDPHTLPLWKASAKGRKDDDYDVRRAVFMKKAD